MRWIRIGVAATGLFAAFLSATVGTASAALGYPRITSASAAKIAVLRVPRLGWVPCHDGFQCATARVPLDYQHPDGATTRIAVIRHLAGDRAHPAGTLFFNGGGPGPQIESFVAGFPGFPAALRERFNIITFDERGFGLSNPVRCFPDAAAENRFLGDLPQAFPVGARPDAIWEKTFVRFDARCVRHAGPLLQHDTSTDAARDLDLIRQAVGVRKLNYVGLSYGTGLGAIYANLFPVTVGRMVLDGNLNPVAWSEGGSRPEALRDGQDLAAASVLRSFLDLCGKATNAACAFSAGTPAATRAKYATLLRRLRRHSVTAGNPPQTFTYAVTINDVPLGFLAFVRDWPSTAVLLQQLWTASTAGQAPTGAGHRPARWPARWPARRSAYSGPEQAVAEFCADTADPHGTRAYQAAARFGRARSGGIGLGLAWQEEPCAQWAAGVSQDRYTGPWNRRTASPILVIGNTGDPITPYRDAVAMSRDLARARLLTVSGFGHTENLNPDACATGDEIRYLETGALPPAGTVCSPDTQPFPGS
jgi:pimeloyl-ACP methyl ester carboxylesterase